MPFVLALLVVTGTLGAAPPVSAGVLECGELLECLPVEEPCTEPECLPDPCEEVSCWPDPCHWVDCDCLYDGDCKGGEPVVPEAPCQGLECAPDPCESADCDPEAPCVDEECPRVCNTHTGCLLPGTVCGYIDLVAVNSPEDCTERICWLEAQLGEEVVYTGDMDGDGVDDCHDPDVDGDGIGNAVEETIGWTVRNPDTDGDGLPDARDPTPDAADVPVKIVVKALRLQFWQNSVVDDVCSWPDPYLRPGAGVTLSEGGDPAGNQVLELTGLTKDLHPHNVSDLDLRKAGEGPMDTLETLRQDLSSYPKKSAFPGLAAVWLELPFADHDVPYQFPDTCWHDLSGDGHHHDEQEGDDSLPDQAVNFWSLLEFAQSAQATVPVDVLASSELTQFGLDYGNPTVLEFTVQIGTNVPVCALYVAKLSSSLGPPSPQNGNAYIDVSMVREEESLHRVGCLEG